MSNPEFKTIDKAREYVEAFMENFEAKATSRISDRLHTIFSFPPPANTINEEELLNIINEEVKKEIYGA
jgi:CRISPR/Cas system CSM-associated protein Csm4 (group 5 of RAMP superfamily)